jgi:hypothetical protein
MHGVDIKKQKWRCVCLHSLQLVDLNLYPANVEYMVSC